MPFLGIPIEIRLAIYLLILQGYQDVTNNQQPSNLHFRFLRSCRQIYIEAAPIFKRYLSLRTEVDISHFLECVSDASAALVIHLDVANDGRLVLQQLEQKVQCFPVSQLHLAIRKATNVQVLRVFDARAPRPLQHFVSGLRFRLAFEDAMFTRIQDCPCLKAYELYVNPSRRVSIFDCISPRKIEILRLTGNIELPKDVSFPVLRHLVLDGVLGMYFDRKGAEAFAESSLMSLSYVRRTSIGLAVGEQFLSRLLQNSTSSSLTRLVLTSCTQISTAALHACLTRLISLKYFALGFVVFQELNHDFLAVLPASLQVFKLRLSGRSLSPTLTSGVEQQLQSLEINVLKRAAPLQAVHLDIAENLMTQGRSMSRIGHWRELARMRGTLLAFEQWELMEQF